MNTYRNVLFALLLVFNVITLKSQEKGFFRYPIDLQKKLSSTYGELRSNHFHSGIDISTNGIAGVPIKAVDDGYVSRIKVSSGGYGNAIYITHKNGYKSVYGHMLRYEKSIENYITKKQYKNKTFEITLYPEKNELPVKKGQIIGYVGNTGRSFGPHLHFEIRLLDDTPLNPLRFYDIKDDVKPQINTICIYPIGDSSFVDYKNHKKLINLKTKSGIKLISNNIFETYGKIAFGIETYDYMSNSMSRDAAYKVRLWVDSVLWVSYVFDSISFYKTRYINSFIDYKERLTSKRRIQLSYKKPGNFLKIYKICKNNGVVEFYDDKIHIVTYEVFDFKGNKTTVSFKIKTLATPPLMNYASNEDKYNMMIKYNEEAYFTAPGISVFIPAFSLYENLKFRFSADTAKGQYSPLYHVHNIYTPVHNNITISIKPQNLPKKLIKKAVIAQLYKGRIYYVGNHHENGNVVAFTRSFGDYFVTVDTIKPDIKILDLKENMSSENKIVFKITDNLSGISEYDLYIDGQWVLLKYDAKSSKFTYIFDDKISKGKKHKLVLLVSDRCGNKNEYIYNFYK